MSYHDPKIAEARARGKWVVVNYDPFSYEYYYNSEHDNQETAIANIKTPANPNNPLDCHDFVSPPTSKDP